MAGAIEKLLLPTRDSDTSRHVDMSLQRICGIMVRKSLLTQACPKAGDEDGTNQRLVVHKTTGERQKQDGNKEEGGKEEGRECDEG